MAVRKLDVATRKDMLSRMSQEKRSARKQAGKGREQNDEDRRWKPLVMSSSINPYLCHCRDVKNGFANLCPAHMLTFHLAEAVH